MAMEGLRLRAGAVVAANARALRGVFDLDEAPARQWWNAPAKIAQLKKIRDEEGRRHVGGDDPGDAMRHAEASRRASVEVDPASARLAGIANEVVGGARYPAYKARDVFTPKKEERPSLGEAFASMKMDMYNNEVGLRAGAQGRPVDPRDLQVRPR